MYLYNYRKSSRMVHLLNEGTGKSYCQMENGLRKKSMGQLTISEVAPSGRPVCMNCLDLEQRK